MAKLTLLSIVNTYMDMTDGFRVATIDDTIESQQVASLAEKVFNEVISDVFNNSLSRDLVQLESLADVARPNYLALPDNVLKIERNQVMYNVAKSTGSSIKFKKIPYLDPPAFLEKVGLRSTEATGILEVEDFSGYDYVIRTDKAPDYFTSFDDKYLVFDSHDSDIESTLQGSKSGIMTSSQRTFTQSDAYEIDLPEWFHPTYQNLVIAESSEALREEPLFSVAKKGKLGLLRARKKQRIGASTRKALYGRRV